MRQNDSRIQKNLGPVLLGIGSFALFIGGLSIILYVVQFGNTLSAAHDKWAEFGDYAGGVLGSIFAFLGLIALLLTLWVQSRELQISTTELRRSAEALKDQNNSINLQSFENRFFNMISLHHEIVKGIDLVSNDGITTSGRDCLKVYYGRLKNKLNPAVRGDSIDYKEAILSGYEGFYRAYAHDLGHYFRNIYRVLKFLDDSDSPNKKEYSGILRAQLSDPELALLFYNGLTPRGHKFKKLAEDYSLFENLEPSQLVNTTEDAKFYAAEAFGEHAELFKAEGFTKK